MFERLEQIRGRLQEILAELSSPRIQGSRMAELMKEQAELTPVTEAYESYLQVEKEKSDCADLMAGEQDPEMRELLSAELQDLEGRSRTLASELKILLIPRDPDDDRSVIVEIRAGAGGDEAALFAADLFRMYTRYADRHGYSSETLSVSENGLGGFKEVTFRIAGRGAYSRLKFESGTHRVQRVPETESAGRIHTSTATVAIMPEAEEVDVDLNMEDCRFDVFRSSGHGGQSVNTTDSAVRLTHVPTGIVISCQDEKSQLKNRAKALMVLRSKLYDLERRRLHSERAELRRSQVGTGDRSEKIRTYNFPQGRVTDHRAHLTLHRIDSVMDGDLDEMIDALAAAERSEKLAGSGQEN